MKPVFIICEHDFQLILDEKIVFTVVRNGTYYGAKVNDALVFVDMRSGDAVTRVVRQVEEVRPGMTAYGFSPILENEMYSHILGFEPVENMPGLFKDDRDGALVNVRDEDFINRVSWHVDDLERKIKGVFDKGRA